MTMGHHWSNSTKAYRQNVDKVGAGMPLYSVCAMFTVFFVFLDRGCTDCKNLNSIYLDHAGMNFENVFVFVCESVPGSVESIVQLTCESIHQLY